MVCPNSRRLADYLIKHGHCSSSKIRIVPNATRASNLLPEPPSEPGPLPDDIANLPRPIAGVIGNLAGNMDWLLIEQLVKLSPGMNWAFVGPTTMAIPDPVHSKARDRVMRLPNARFTGQKPYGALAAYARSFDVAVLPYRRCEPTYSGSSTRFYEHLAACRPMIATPGLEELTRKQPLLRLVETADEAAKAMAELRSVNFDDGLTSMRWKESQHGTWQARAAFVEHELYALGHAGLAARQPNGSHSEDKQHPDPSGAPPHLSMDAASRQ
jgi:glycosyltransferase involved in cell wall biosynthesis